MENVYYRKTQEETCERFFIVLRNDESQICLTPEFLHLIITVIVEGGHSDVAMRNMAATAHMGRTIRFCCKYLHF